MQLLDIYLEPTKVFDDLKARPTFLLPLAVMVLLTVAFTLTYFLRVDPAWFTDFVLSAAGQQLSAAELAQAKQFMPSARTQGYIGAGMTFIVLPLITCVMAAYYLLAGKIAGAAVSFKHGLALTAWSGMPTALGALVGLVGALMMAPQTPQHSLMLTNLDPLLLQLPMDHAFSGLAKNFSLLTFWALGLAALGWRRFTGAGWTAAVIVAVLPTLLIYGVWLAFALL
jgi:hypothetical protein